MEEFENYLRLDIEKKINFKILSTTEAKWLLAILAEQDIHDISLSTIRRFWGIIPKRNTSQTTLNKFSIFLGNASFQNFIQSKTKYGIRKRNNQLQSLKQKKILQNRDISFLQELYKQTSTTDFIVSLFEHGLFFKKWDFISKLLEISNNAFLKLDRPNDFRLDLAHHILTLVYMLDRTFIADKVDYLLKMSSFKTNVLYQYIDVMRLNGIYGEMIYKIDQKSISYEENLFLKLLKNLHNYLNGNSISAFTTDEQKLINLPVVLVGRYFGYQILYHKINNNQVKCDQFWSRFKAIVKNSKVPREYLHEMINHLLYAKDIVRLNYISEVFYECILEEINMDSENDLFIINLIDIMQSYLENKINRARRIFAGLNIDRFQYSTPRDFFMFYYVIVGYHIFEDKKSKNYYLNLYHSLAETTKFGLFDKVYLETFFEG